MWTLKEIRLSKLLLLSFSEKEHRQSEKMYQRICRELEKYQKFEAKIYYEEMDDLHFNRIQSLLMTNDLMTAQKAFANYQRLVSEADDLYLALQLEFIKYLLFLYTDFDEYLPKMQELLHQLKHIKTSETHFYTIIFQIHHEKAQNYYQRYVKKV